MVLKCGKNKQLAHETIAKKPAVVVNLEAMRVLNEKNV